MKPPYICIALPFLFALGSCAPISSASNKDDSPIEQSVHANPAVSQGGHDTRRGIAENYRYDVNESSRRCYREVMKAVENCTGIDVYKVYYCTGEERLIKHIDSASELAQIRQTLHDCGTMYERTHRRGLCVSTVSFYSVRFKKEGKEIFSLSFKRAVNECYYLELRDDFFVSLLDLLLHN